MKTFRVIASASTYVHTFIEAESEAVALKLAEEQRSNWRAWELAHDEDFMQVDPREPFEIEEADEDEDED